jgi:cytochrome c553
MTRLARLFVGSLLLGGLVAMPSLLRPFAAWGEEAAPSARDIRQRLDAAGKLADADKFADAIAPLQEAIKGLEAMAALPRPPAGLKPLAATAETIRRKLERGGADVKDLKIPGAAVPAGKPGAAGAPAAAKEAISFSKQVAPILAKSCGGCHVTGKRGNFQMATYAMLMTTGMVQKGQGNDSRLVEVILSGDMPRGGGKVSPEDLATLMKWIDSGAGCDADPTTPIDALARGGAAAPRGAAPAVQAVKLKPGEVSFAFDVAPVLLEHCATCHDADDPAGRLQMVTLETLLRGGESGPVVDPGKGSSSLIVRKLRGQEIEGQRMPLGKKPLSDEQIATIEKWISQGARLDMLTGKTALDTLAAAGRAVHLSDADLAKIRFAAGRKVWKRAIPDEEAEVRTGDGVCLIGNLPPSRMDELAEVAAAVRARVSKELSDGDRPFVKGGVVVFAFRQSYDYSALWQNVVGVERPKGVQGNAGTSGDVVYGAMLVPANDDSGDDTRLLLAEQIAAAAFAGRGDIPDWFARGAGRAVAIKIAPKAPLALEWRREAGPALQQIGSADEFLSGHADPAAAALVSGGFVSSIASTSSKLEQMLTLVDEGAPFADAFMKVFRATPQQALGAWAAKEAKAGPRR